MNPSNEPVAPAAGVTQPGAAAQQHGPASITEPTVPPLERPQPLQEKPLPEPRQEVPTPAIQPVQTGSGSDAPPEARGEDWTVPPLEPLPASVAPEPGPKPPSATGVDKGMTTEEVQKILGSPASIADLNTRLIYFYQRLKVFFVFGKVSEVQQIEGNE
jgi:hypothetical protein